VCSTHRRARALQDRSSGDKPRVGTPDIGQQRRAEARSRVERRHGVALSSFRRLVEVLVYFRRRRAVWGTSWAVPGCAFITLAFSWGALCLLRLPTVCVRRMPGGTVAASAELESSLHNHHCLAPLSFGLLSGLGYLYWIKREASQPRLGWARSGVTWIGVCVSLCALLAFVGAINAPRRIQQRVVVTPTSQQRCSRLFAPARPPREFSNGRVM